MGFIRAFGYCPFCHDTVVFTRFVCPLWIHMVMTVATLGVWLLAAPLARLHHSQWRCGRCGHRAPVGQQALLSPNPHEARPAAGRRRSAHEDTVNTLLVGSNLVYYLPTNATFRNNGAD
jgi:hypothetical protein